MWFREVANVRHRVIRYLALAICSICIWSVANRSLAQGSEDRAAFKAAQAKLGTYSRADQFAFAAERCQDGFSERRRDEARIWCALATRRAVSQLDARGGSRPSAELDIVSRALWLSAVDGLHYQNDPWWGSPRAETIIIGDDLRRLSLVVLADLNRQNASLMEFNFERLAGLLGVRRQKGESNGQLRRRALRRLDALIPSPTGYKPADEDVLWAKAALGLTILLRDPRDDFPIEGRDVATMLSGVAETAYERYPNDPGLAPALFYAEAMARNASGDHRAAMFLFSQGARICEEQIWKGAILCNMLQPGQRPD